MDPVAFQAATPCHRHLNLDERCSVNGGALPQRAIPCLADEA